MRVQKRNGDFEEVSFDKFSRGFNHSVLGQGKKLNIDPTVIAQRVCSEIYDEVKTSELDKLSSQTSISMYSKNPDYAKLASRIVVSNHHKGTKDDYFEVIENLYENKVVQGIFVSTCKENKDVINNSIDYTKIRILIILDSRHLKRVIC